MKLLICILSIIFKGCQGQSYAILAPDIVRPNTDFLVAVSVFDLEDGQTQDVELRIRGRSVTSGSTIEIR